MSNLHAKPDECQAEIVAGLRAAGCSVHLTHMVGGGFPDAVVGRMVDGYCRNFLLEFKRVGGKLNPRQALWHAAWKGQVATVETLEQALRACELIR